ncbi:MAG: TetR/AcrR family transcriptional regulator [Deltaproteobacteria bacterium]|nr:TetR/AcrR family transcriptional regulator [Deltaproteobacteria bacterium]
MPKKSRKDDILKAAEKVFSEYPYPSASMRMIAREAQIDHPLIIYYFPTKADLFEAVVKEVTEKLSRAMPAWYQGISEMGLSGGVSAYLDRALEFHRKNPELMRVILLNMVQSNRKSMAIPGYRHIQEVFEFGARVFREHSRYRTNPRQLSIMMKGFSLLMINLMGAREYHAEIQGLDPKSDAYFKWAKDVILFMILPVLHSFELKE